MGSTVLFLVLIGLYSLTMATLIQSNMNVIQAAELPVFLWFAGWATGWVTSFLWKAVAGFANFLGWKKVHTFEWKWNKPQFWGSWVISNVLWITLFSRLDVYITVENIMSSIVGVGLGTLVITLFIFLPRSGWLEPKNPAK